MNMASLEPVTSKDSKDESDPEKAIPATQTDTTVTEARPTFLGGAHRCVPGI
jgi:hypothetical protein